MRRNASRTLRLLNWNVFASGASDLILQPGFFVEPKRRHVYRAATAYCIVTWLLVQVMTTMTPRCDHR